MHRSRYWSSETNRSSCVTGYCSQRRFPAAAPICAALWPFAAARRNRAVYRRRRGRIGEDYPAISPLTQQGETGELGNLTSFIWRPSTELGKISLRRSSGATLSVARVKLINESFATGSMSRSRAGGWQWTLLPAVLCRHLFDTAAWPPLRAVASRRAQSAVSRAGQYFAKLRKPTGAMPCLGSLRRSPGRLRRFLGSRSGNCRCGS